MRRDGGVLLADLIAERTNYRMRAIGRFVARSGGDGNAFYLDRIFLRFGMFGEII